MEFWKVVLMWGATMTVQSFGFLWALNKLFGLGIDYSVVTVLASMVFLFCVNGRLPLGKRRSASGR